MKRWMIVQAVVVELGLPGESQLALGALVYRHGRSVSSSSTLLREWPRE
jgi:hypothetical protein